MANGLTDVFVSLWSATVQSVPNLVLAAILLVVGLVLGKIVGRVVKEVLNRTKLDYYITETQKPAISISNIFALAARWWIYVAFIGEAVKIMNFMVLNTVLLQILNFIPKVIAASLILVVSYVLAEYIKEQLKKTGKLYANFVGKILFFFVLYVSIAIALPVLGIESTLVGYILLIIIGSVGLGIAIALGLGLKDAVADVSKRYVKKLKI